MPALEKERKYLDSHRDELLKQYGGNDQTDFLYQP